MKIENYKIKTEKCLEQLNSIKKIETATKSIKHLKG